jgi:hypothetical protein
MGVYQGFCVGANDGNRTRDPQFGKVMLFVRKGYPFRYSGLHILCRRLRVVMGMAGRIGLPATRAA